MKKYYELSERAVVNAGNSIITVYGDTAKLVNTLVGFAVIVSFIAFLSKVAK